MSSLRRPAHHTYDYNFKVGESSYRDMLDYLDKKEAHRAASPPPGKKTFAERFAEKPFYGEPRPLQLRNSELPQYSLPRRTADLEPSPTPPRRSDRKPLRFADDDAGCDVDDLLKTRPRPTMEVDMTDPDEMIAAMRRRNRERMELMSSMEEPEEGSSPAPRRARAAAAGDGDAALTSSARAVSSSSYTASSSMASKMSSSRSSTRTSHRQE